MKLTAFSVYDSKAAAYITPFFTPTIAMGTRSFGEAANDPNLMFARHPSDYTLFEIGEFDLETGELKKHDALINHGLAITYQTQLHVVPRVEDAAASGE